MMRKLPLIPFFITFVFILSACSNLPFFGKQEKTERPTENVEQDLNAADKEANEKEQIPEAATDVEGMLTEGPGEFGGKQYDEEKIKAKIDQWEESLSATEAYNRLISLVAEDYEPYRSWYDDYKVDWGVDNAPGEMSDEEDTKVEKQMNVAVLLDASGSMGAHVEGGIKMDLAKQAAEDFAEDLPDEANVSLIVYGHKGSSNKEDKQKSCDGVEEVYQLDTYDKKEFNNTLSEFEATGYTPIAASMIKAKETLSEKSGENTKNLVYIISDGEETCGGDPVEEAKSLHESNVEAVVNIIGFDVDNDWQKELKKAADAGGGSYATVNSGNDLKKELSEQRAALKDEWIGWKVSNKLSLQEQRLEAKSLIRENREEFKKTIRMENERLSNLFSYIEENNLLEDLQYSDLNMKISNRKDMLTEYNIDNRDELFERVRSEMDKKQGKVEERKKEESPDG